MRFLRRFLSRFIEVSTRGLKEKMDLSMRLSEEMKEQLDLSVKLSKEIKEQADISVKLSKETKELQYLKEEKDNQLLAYMREGREMFYSSQEDDALAEEMCLIQCDVKSLLAKLNELVGGCKIGANGGGVFKQPDNARSCFVSSKLGIHVEKSAGLDIIENIDEWEKNNNYSKLVMLNPKSIYQFMTKKTLYENVMNIKDEIIFLMPYIHQRTFQVIWDEGFGDVENDGKSYWRWFIGDNHTGKIIVYNDFDCYKSVIMQFEVYTANPKASVIVRCGMYTKIMDMGMEEHSFKIETNLVPGINEIEMTFCGEVCNLSEEELRLCQFTVTNFCIYEAENDKVYSGRSVYEKVCDSSYSRYILSESYIRNKLHRHGCFEIETYCCRMDGIYPFNVTRAYVWEGGYYTLSGENSISSDYDGLVLYIARRRGTVKDEK